MGLLLPSPSSASSEPPPHSLQGSARNLPLVAPSPWSVGEWSSLAKSPAFTSAHIPVPAWSPPFLLPSFPTFSVVQRDHHSLPDLLPLQLPSLKHHFLPPRLAKTFSNGYILSPLIRPAVGLWSVRSLWEASDSSWKLRCVYVWSHHPTLGVFPGSFPSGFVGSGMWMFLVQLFAMSTGIKLVVQGLTWWSRG